MRTTLTNLFLLLCSFPLFANDIDKLETDVDVEKFIRGQFPALSDARIAFKDFLYPGVTNQRIADSLNIKLWQKTDFENNGKTDLLVYLSTGGQNYLTAIIDEGNSFSAHFISRWPFTDTYFPAIKKTGKLTLLLLYKTCAYCHGSNITKISVDTLTYKFGGFVEYAAKVPAYKIEKVEFSTEPYNGTCPVYKLNIQANRKAEYNALSYNDTTGQFSGVIDNLHYNKLTSIINYLDLPDLKDNYSVVWTDAPKCTLSITYNGGKTKTIEDYGEEGTSGLNLLYNFLSDLRRNQIWK